MAKAPRTILEDYDLIEVSNRTVHRRLLLRPSAELKAIIDGALGRAQRKYGVEVHAYVFLSNHYHLLISPTDAQKMARFVGYFQSKIAKEVGRLYGWRDKLWSRRYDHVPVRAIEADQVARLSYVLDNSCKEGLVYSPLTWPGASTARALQTGKMQVDGVWIDRTAQWLAEQRKQPYDPAAHRHAETVRLTPLPCWKHLDPSTYSRRVAAMIETVEQETRARHKAMGTRPLGVKRIRKQHPHRKPIETKRSPRPRVHALTRAARKAFWSAWREFVAAYRAAAEILRDGETEAVFPAGCFPPGRPFVPT